VIYLIYKTLIDVGGYVRDLTENSKIMYYNTKINKFPIEIPFPK
jgi:hypothetical protein